MRIIHARSREELKLPVATTCICGICFRIEENTQPLKFVNVVACRLNFFSFPFLETNEFASSKLKLVAIFCVLEDVIHFDNRL